MTLSLRAPHTAPQGHPTEATGVLEGLQGVELSYKRPRMMNTIAPSITHMRSTRTEVGGASVTTRTLTIYQGCVTLRYVALRCVTLHYVALHYVTLHYVALHCVTLRCVTLGVTLRVTLRRRVTLRVTLRHRVTLKGELTSKGGHGVGIL